MKETLLWLLDYFFMVFHTLFSIFNITGWMWRRTRPFHLASIIITAFSWGVLGFFYGWGYCFCTDWHWQVREALGNPVESYSYIHFLILELTGINFNPELVDITVLTVFLLSAILSVFFNLRDRKSS